MAILMKGTQPDRVRLGAFELDLRAGELRLAGVAAEAEGGNRVLLPEQPFRLLLMLVERAGAMVTREEIQKKFWPNDTIVEFDHSINVAIGKLRKALGDSGDEPKYIETIPRRGYRLIVPVEWLDAVGSSDQGAPSFRPPLAKELEPGSSLIGKKVSHYRVLEVIGGGGMGLVYKAEDLKLGRRVALKFLPEELASDAVALQRFEREAQTASSLNHPNICTIYEIEEHEGQPFIVMELLEGETLRDRLASSETKAVPIDQLLDIAIQICDGLQAAHEKSVIHRDIKPANIFLTALGQVKILDFGLAKLVAADEGTENPHPSKAGLGGAPAHNIDSLVSGHDFSRADQRPPPLSSGLKPATPHGEPTLTRTGSAMGTAGYMSPEQVRGEKLDARTDLFSFGLVLYEMATGQRAFSGETAAVVHDAILNNSPVPLHELNSTLPPKFVATIDKALEKDREKRYQSAAEMGADLRALQQRSPARWGMSRWTILGAAAVIVCIIVLFLLRSNFRSRGATEQPVVRQLTSRSSDSPVLEQIALSPDGKHLAYADGVRGLAVLQVDTGESRSYPDTDAFVPNSWLPDGDHLFVSKVGEPGTWNLSTLDGTKRKFQDESINPAPSPDGRQILFDNGENEIWLMNAAGEARRRVLSVPSPWTLQFIAWSPTGQRIAYEKSRTMQADMSKVWANVFEVTLDTCDLEGHCSTIFSDPRLHLETNFSAFVWLPDGRIIFALRELPPDEHSSDLWSLEVDPSTGRVSGAPKRLTNWSGFEQGDLTASANGKRLAFQQKRIETTSKIAELRAEGSQFGAIRPLNAETWYSRPAGWTHDSKAVLFIASRYGKNGIFKQSVNDRSPQALVAGSGIYDPAVISPDGRWLLYTEHLQDGSTRIMRMPLDGGTATAVLSGDYGYRCASAPSTLCVLSELKGSQVVFSVLDPFNGRGRELLSVPLSGGSQLSTYAWSLSSDGKNIALVDSGTQEQVRVLGIEGGVRVVPLKGWTVLQSVNWSADGRHLYVSGGQIYSAGFTEWGILEADLTGKFKVLIKVPNSRAWVAHPTPSPDGRYLTYTEWDFASSVAMLENF